MMDEVEQNRANEDEQHDDLVDDLASEADFWLSITDAARVTRRQEITIRRWIAARELPVRRQRVGHNKRTRHVRASDLAKLTPIIDPTAGISGAPANVDLMAIPQHQAHLYQVQQEQEKALGQLLTNLVELGQEVSDQGKRQQQELTQLRMDLAKARQHLSEQLAQTVTFWDEQLVQQRQTLETAWQVVRTQLEQNNTELALHLGAAITHLTQQLETAQANADQAQSKMSRQIAEQRRQIHTEIQVVANQLPLLQRQVEDMGQIIQEQIKQTTQRLQAIELGTEDLAQQLQARLDKDARIEVRLAALELQRRRGSYRSPQRRRTRGATRQVEGNARA